MIDINKLRDAMHLVSAEKGDFVLFGLFLREEAPDKWDLVVSAPWLEEGKLVALSEFIKKIAPVVGEQELLALSRIITLNHDDPNLESILRAFSIEDGALEIKDSTLFGMGIKHAYIIRAKRVQQILGNAA